MQDQRTVRDSTAASDSMDADTSSSSTRPVSIPEPKVLPYSRLSLRAHSASSISPSPSQRILSTGSPGQDYTLGALQPLQGSGLQPLNPSQQGQLYPRSRPGDSPRGPALQQNKRPPLPPSPQASRVQAAAGSLNPLTPAWINPGDGSGSGSGGRQPRLLSAAATGSYGEPGILSSAVGSSSGSMSLRQYSYLQQQQQQQQYGQYASSTGSAHSMSPSADGLLAAAVASEDVAAAAGNPYHPQHESAMQLLLEHQTQQLQQLQQQRDQTSMGGSSSISSARAGYMRASSFSNIGLSPRSSRMSPRSPRTSPRAPSRSSSYNRLSELGTSPGLIEASFMGMTARCSQHTTSSSSTSRSATLQQMMQQQQAAIRAQQEEQQRSLQHSRSTVSFGEWNGTQMGSGSDSAAVSRSGSPPLSAGGRYRSESTGAQQALDWDAVQQQLQQQQQQQQGALGEVGASLPRVGEGRGLRALPGRPGLHWLSRADERESAARGLLGLPRPGLRPFSSSSSRGQRQQQLHQQQSPRQRQIAAAAGDIQQQQQQQREEGEQEAGQGDSYAAGEADDDICLHTPAAAATQPTPQRIHYDPAVFASYSAAVAGTNGIQRAASSSGSPMAASASRSLFSSRSFGRQNSASVKDRAQSAGSDLLRRSGSYLGMPTCLICLDQLTPGDFDSGEAMYLACRCKGEVALRHRQCAEKWSRIKGNTICDVCKAPILNLPEVPPLPAPPPPPAMDDRLFFQGTGLWGPLGDEPPAVADYVFDCIRVTWVVLIVCILFFELSVSQAFVTGALVGSAYVALTASLASCRRLRRQRQQEEGEGGAWQEGLRVPLLGGGRAHLLPV